MIYLDNAASWPILPSVMGVLGRSLADDYANLSAAHRLGKDLFERVEVIRQDFLNLVDAPQGYQFYFTSSATESNNWAIWQRAFTSCDEILYSRADHPSITVPLEKSGAKLRNIPRHMDGRIDQNQLSDMITTDTKGLFVTWVNGQSGHLEDVAALAREAKRRNPEIYVHVDGVQGFGKHAISLRDDAIDSFSLSSHKIGGPKGIAGIYFRTMPSKLLLHGGGQEHGMRAGTPPFPLIVAMQEAAQWMNLHRETLWAKMQQLNQAFRSFFSTDKIISFPFLEEHCSPYIVMLVVRGVSSDIILRHLEMEQVFCASTAACSSKIKGTNPTFLDLRIPEDLHKNVLRLSFGQQNSLEDVKTSCNLLNRVLQTISLLTHKR
ncbi:MAG: aminotransferase class V-fold PLP-dependent enzyme [Bdellovibrio sp.]|nr:aminotransferase class V-fold PLP-dependent enzyme [Bdellovibrio sp.]